VSSIIPSPSKGAVSAVTQANGLTLTSGMLAMGTASTVAAGAMSAADKTKLDAVSGTNTGNVSLDGASSSWLTLVGQVLKLTLVAASDTVQGIMTTAAQTFAGPKTFAATLIASAGIQVASLFNTNGTSSGDRGVVVGFSTDDGSVNAGAKPLSVGTGVGGTYVEAFHVRKGGGLRPAAGSGSDVALGTAGDDDTGFWFPAANTINVVTGGTFRTQWTSTGVLSHQGPISMPTNNLFSLGASSFYERTSQVVVLSGVQQFNEGGVARPTANAANRGCLWYSKSAAGAADTVQICLKSAADTYSWVTIATG
jgi:hypothetical protein